MSLERRLILPVFLGLLASLLVGASLSYQHAVSRVRIEMRAALAVGRRVVQHAVQEGGADGVRGLAAIVSDFDGDRHILATWRGVDGRIMAQSRLEAPAHPAPDAVFGLVGGRPMQAVIDLPAAWRGAGQLRIETDSHNEVAEAWGDLELALAVMSLFFCLILGLSIATLRRSLRPLQDLAGALERIGARDYAARLNWRRYRELEPVQRGFNGMAERLAGMETQNRLLAARIARIQEEERAEIARDLHDEVAPFLFAVSAEAALIRQKAARGDLAAIEPRARSISESVAHMQKHLREVLSRLMPDVLLDLGLPGAVEALVHFWRARKPEIAFAVQVTEARLDDRQAAVAFRVVQESLSNAIRHAAPSRIELSVRAIGEALEIEVRDDGIGLPPKADFAGLGLLGMRERVRALGGRFDIGNRPDGRGVRVRAVLAHPAACEAAE